MKKVLTNDKIISIHALREEGDSSCSLPMPPDSHFYPRPPRGGRLTYARMGSALILFLSTPSARRATRIRQTRCKVIVISIHALREEGDSLDAWHYADDYNISIHALREEGDMETLLSFMPYLIFLSTPSARRATSAEAAAERAFQFLSTPSARRATQCSHSRRHGTKFLSTPSARRATGIHGVSSTSPIFLSTPSARRAT